MKKLKEGDIFSIPLDKEHVGYGQIVKIPSNAWFLIVVYKKIYPKHTIQNAEEVIQDQILLMGNTMDARIYHGYWEIVANTCSNLESIMLPFYKIGFPESGRMYITDYTGVEIRESNINEYNKLNFLKVVAPIRFEKAFQAQHLMATHEPYYNELKIEAFLNGTMDISHTI